MNMYTYTVWDLMQLSGSCHRSHVRATIRSWRTREPFYSTIRTVPPSGWRRPADSSISAPLLARSHDPGREAHQCNSRWRRRLRSGRRRHCSGPAREVRTEAFQRRFSLAWPAFRALRAADLGRWSRWWECHSRATPKIGSVQGTALLPARVCVCVCVCGGGGGGA